MWSTTRSKTLCKYAIHNALRPHWARTFSKMSDGPNEFKLDQPPSDGISAVKFSPTSSNFILASSWDAVSWKISSQSVSTRARHTLALLHTNSKQSHIMTLLVGIYRYSLVVWFVLIVDTLLRQLLSARSNAESSINSLAAIILTVLKHLVPTCKVLWLILPSPCRVFTCMMFRTTVCGWSIIILWLCWTAVSKMRCIRSVEGWTKHSKCKYFNFFEVVYYMCSI